MSSRRHTIQVFEHQTLKVGEDPRFKLSHFKVLSSYGYKSKEHYYSVGNQRIKFSQYVGVIQVKDLTIEILPKTDNYEISDSSRDVWHNALIGMLQECRLIKLRSISNATLKLKSASILDLYFDAFLTETELIVRQGLIKQYMNISENLNKVKGKIAFAIHFRRNFLHKERFYVEHQIYDLDNRYNQIILKALNILSQISANPKFSSRIKSLQMHFEAVSDVSITSSWFDILSYNRNSERYKGAITLAKLIILRYSPDLRGGNENVLAILFDMNRLFENYIYRKLKILEYSSEIPINRIREQPKRPFWESSYLKADILVECDSHKYVIDTKWKVPGKNKPSDQDIKQMFIYDLHYGTNLSILLYPKTTQRTHWKKPFKNESYRDRHCQMAFADLFNDDCSLNRNVGYQIYRELLEPEIKRNAEVARKQLC